MDSHINYQSLLNQTELDSTNLLFTGLNGVIKCVDGSLTSPADTSDVPEGKTNLYYTTSRANTDFDVRLLLKTTTNLAEGSNLYYTTTRANTDFDTRLLLKTTTNLSEGSNLYYTSARANTDFDLRLLLKSTSDLAEGTNLYYTDARTRAALSAGSGLSYNSSTGQFSSTGSLPSAVNYGDYIYYTNSAWATSSSRGSGADMILGKNSGNTSTLQTTYPATLLGVGNQCVAISIDPYSSNKLSPICIGNTNAAGGGCISIGQQSGHNSALYALNIGGGCGNNSSSNTFSVNLGLSSGQNNQGSGAFALGSLSGYTSQGANAVAIGSSSGQTNQSANSITIGSSSGSSSAKTYSVNIGSEAGYNSAGTNTINIGGLAGRDRGGGNNSINLGYYAGYQANNTQCNIGSYNAFLQSSTTNEHVITCGFASIQQNPGRNSISIGAYATATGSAANSIVINANTVNAGTVSASNSGLYITPIRYTNFPSGLLGYNSTTKEITFATSILLPNMHLDIGNWSTISADSSGGAVFSNNSYRVYNQLIPANQFCYTNTHGSLGTAGVYCDQGSVYLYGSTGATTANAVFTPTYNATFSSTSVNLYRDTLITGKVAIGAAPAVTSGYSLRVQNPTTTTDTYIGGATDGINTSGQIYTNVAFRAPLTTPASSTATGTQGMMQYDANYIYICTSANNWKRVALSAF